MALMNLNNILCRHSICAKCKEIARSIYISSHLKSNISAVNDPENKGKETRGVNFDTLGCWNNKLVLPVLYDQSVRRGKIIPKIPLDEIAVESVLGRRKDNEDRYVIEELQSELLYFGLFDGHGGAYAADFMTEQMSRHLRFWLSQTSDLTLVLQNAFCDAQNLLARHLAFYHIDSPTFKTGTTATVCLLRQSSELCVGHVGDSVALLCRGGATRRLSVDHEPEDEAESQRITRRGGKIIHNSHGVAHVNGRLAMTRSLGDVELKPCGVSARPSLQSLQIKHGKDAFLVLCSDGLSFTISDQEIVNIVSSCIHPQEAVSRLIDQAQHFGSEDNVTVMVVPLGAWGKYQQSNTTNQYSFGRILTHSRIY